MVKPIATGWNAARQEQLRHLEAFFKEQSAE